MVLQWPYPGNITNRISSEPRPSRAGKRRERAAFATSGRLIFESGSRTCCVLSAADASPNVSCELALHTDVFTPAVFWRGRDGEAGPEAGILFFSQAHDLWTCRSLKTMFAGWTPSLLAPLLLVALSISENPPRPRPQQPPALLRGGRRLGLTPEGPTRPRFWFGDPWGVGSGTAMRRPWPAVTSSSLRGNV